MERNWERDDVEELALRREKKQKESEKIDVNGSGGEENDGGDSENKENSKKTTTTTVKKRRKTLNENHLLSEEGFKKIYQTFPQEFHADVTGNEEKALSKLIGMYKEWAFDLYPGLAFEDFIDRVEVVSKTHAVSGLVSDLREEESKRCRPQEPEEEEEIQENQPESMDGDHHDPMTML